jgi:predicted regulator of Ras-like GTPase activity (Roadblock/LC7/MglB family)
VSDEQLNFVLKTLINDVEGIKSVALVSREGLIVNSILDEDVSPMHIAAMSAIILSTCERVLLELKRGELDVCIIQGTEGKFIVMECGEDFILVGVLEEDARMDQAFTKMRASVNKIVDLTEDF